MSEDIDRSILRKYDVVSKLGKGVSITVNDSVHVTIDLISTCASCRPME